LFFYSNSLQWHKELAEWFEIGNSGKRCALSIGDATQMVLLAPVIEGLLQAPATHVLQLGVSCVNCQVISIPRALFGPVSLWLDGKE